MKTQDLPRGVRALSDVLTQILTDLPEGCLPDSPVIEAPENPRRIDEETAEFPTIA
jgi:hypothetical protein